MSNRYRLVILSSTYANIRTKCGTIPEHIRDLYTRALVTATDEDISIAMRAVTDWYATVKIASDKGVTP